MTTLVIGLATSLVAAVAALLIAVAFARPRGLSPGEALRVYPDLVRLLASLSRDRRVGRAVRWRLLVALVYNAQPFNLIPDFVPVVGFAAKGWSRRGRCAAPSAGRGQRWCSATGAAAGLALPWSVGCAG